VAEIEKLEAEAAEHALAFQKVIGERAADRSSSGRLRRLRRLRRQAEHAERERGRMHAELQSELERAAAAASTPRCWRRR